MPDEQKKGMSKGCMVGLIIGIVLIVIIAGTIGACWFFKDDLVKMGATTIVGQVKTELATNPVDDVDTTRFNALADAFIVKMGEEEPFDLEKCAMFVQRLQAIASDQDIDAADVETLASEMVDYYPDLAPLWETPEEDPDADMMEDSLATEQ
ncbi:MAG: hypothetical protein KKA42_16935 [candidate division Zixibacteria bacterium]|nr:hypothetical protein [candidate division Zixibacteria bacterium]